MVKKDMLSVPLSNIVDVTGGRWVVHGSSPKLEGPRFKAGDWLSQVQIDHLVEKEEKHADDSFLKDLQKQANEEMVSRQEERKAPVVSLASRCEVEITCMDDHVRTTTKHTANWRQHVTVTEI